MLRILLVPSLLLAAVIAFVAMKPGPTVANPDAIPTSRPPYTPTASPTVTPVPDLPDGVTGRLTYRTGRQLVTVRLPDVIEEQRYIPAETPADDLSSAYGWWVALGGDDTCTITIHPANTSSDTIAKLDFSACNATAWSSDRRHYAVIASTADGHTQLAVIDGETPQPRVLIDGTDNIAGFAWHGDRLLVSGGFAGRPSLRWLALDGALTPIAGIASAPMYVYASPDGSRFLFTQSSPDGWQLWMLDAATNAVANLGNMGSDLANASPPNETGPENTGKGGPMYIAWSPDGTQVAFGGGFDPPYIMTTVQLDTGARATTQFPNGYPGEIRWTDDSKRIAVSTYDVERTHHETWVVDPLTGAGRHIMDGCIIVWSPDGRFLAVHGEDIAGITIINADTAARTQLTHTRDDAPIAWTE
jgi:Tol biopolymer transport system component